MNRKRLLYSVLKEIENGNVPSEHDYELTLEQWGEILQMLLDEGLAKGIAILYGDDTVCEVNLESSRITFKGMNYLEENSVLSKSYKGIKEVISWIKP